MPTKLIIIRGPSAVGKSTVAKALMEHATRPTVLVELDYFRFCFVNPPVEDHNLEYDLAASNMSIALEKGFDVIFEANFRAAPNDPFITRLYDAHPDENYLFYLEGSLTETLRRHEHREDQRITANKMAELHKYASPTGHSTEVVIAERSTLEQTVAQIKRVTGT